MARSNTKAVAKPRKKKVVKKHAGGRPTKLTPEILTKLEGAFQNGFNDGEACQFAGLEPRTYYRWMKSNKLFCHKIEVAKAFPNKKSKEVIAQSIGAGNTSDAKWWLERKDPDFKPKAQVDNNHTGAVPVVMVEFLGGTKSAKSKNSNTK